MYWTYFYFWGHTLLFIAFIKWTIAFTHNKNMKNYFVRTYKRKNDGKKINKRKLNVYSANFNIKMISKDIHKNKFHTLMWKIQNGMLHLFAYYVLCVHVCTYTISLFVRAQLFNNLIITINRKHTCSRGLKVIIFI